MPFFDLDKRLLKILDVKDFIVILTNQRSKKFEKKKKKKLRKFLVLACLPKMF
jgi:hypothetical protein